jgi:hypothetical protein
VKAGPGNGPVFSPGSISADGRYVVFCSWSANLVPGDRNFFVDVFLRDRVKHTTIRVDLDPKGREVPVLVDPAKTDVSQPGGIADCQASISADGSRVLWRTEQDLLGDGAKTMTYYSYSRASHRIVPVDRLPGTVTGANSQTWHGSSAMSADGRYVVFTTAARMLPADTDDDTDVYRRDVVTGALTMVTHPSAVSSYEAAKSSVDLTATGKSLPDSTAYRRATIDATGRHVAFLAMDLRERLQWGVNYNVANATARIMVADPVARTASVLVSRARTERYLRQDDPPLLEDPVVAADGRSVYYVQPADSDPSVTSQFDLDTTNPTTDPPDPVHNWSVLLSVPVAGGTPVPLTTSPLYAACTPWQSVCVRSDSAGTGDAYHGAEIEAFAPTASGHEVLFWTGMPFVSTDTDTQRDLYVWHG